MNIQPLPTSVASSIAGTDRAASDQSKKTLTSDSHTDARLRLVTSVDTVDKGNVSSDGEADGRQLLDTFERRNDPHEDSESHEKPGDEQPPSPAVESVHGDGRPRLDIQA